MLTIVLVGIILINFALLTKEVIPTSVGMTLTALIAIVLAGPADGLDALQEGFSDFSTIAVLFTAIAVPAHILARSDALEKLGMIIGEAIGVISKKYSRDPVYMVVICSIIMVYVLAGLLHNTTSILVSATIITIICRSYQIPVIPVLSAGLIASNLGGFSTRWGDTPNIIESRIWGLGHSDFFFQILPINVLLVVLLIAFTIISAKLSLGKTQSITRPKMVFSMVEFRARRRNIVIDKRLLFVGVVGLFTAIGGSLFFPEYEIPIAAASIIFCVLADYRDHQSETLFTLGLETYATFLSIFILAHVVARSHIGFGKYLQEFLVQQQASTWAIVITAYFGTLFTEAASWASAAGQIVYDVSPSAKSAWALGAGICAGSSSLITAATAGIILLNETASNDAENKMTFGKYIKTGLSFSTFMVIYYIVIIEVLFP